MAIDPEWLKTIGPIISAFIGAVLGVALKEWFESHRWYSARFLERKVEALGNLHAALVECFLEVISAPPVVQLLPEEHTNSLWAKVEAYDRALAFASIYLDEQDENLMHEMRSQFSLVWAASTVAELHRDAPVHGEGDVRLGEQINHMKGVYRRANARLRELFNPPATRR